VIYVDRSGHPVPPSLSSSAATEARERILAALSTATPSHLDQLSFRFSSRIWLDTRPAIEKLFSNKCAYCETPSAGHSHDVEHFRPKEGALDLGGRVNDHLHYAWLAYDWDNLLLACPACNRMRGQGGKYTGKGARFPVVRARARLGSSVAECRTLEQAVLLDPCHDDPTRHLSFDAEGLCTPKSDRGSTTIDVLGLNREALLVARKRSIQIVALLTEQLRGLARVSQETQESVNARADNLMRELKAALSPGAPHTAAARAQFQRDLTDASVYPKWLWKPLGVMFTELDQQHPQELVPLAATTAAVRSVAPRKTTPVRRFKERRSLPSHAQTWISSIEISNFKALEEISIQLPEPVPGRDDMATCLMLLGENASGKSSILEAIALALIGTRQIAALKVDGREYLRRDAQWNLVGEPARIAIAVEGSESRPIELTIDARTGAFHGPAKEQMVLLGYGPRRFFSNTKGKRRQEGTAARVKSLFDPNSAVTNPTAWLLHARDDEFNAAVRALRHLLLLEEGSVVTRPPKGKRLGKDITFELAHGGQAPLRLLSEGYRTVVATGVDIMREMLTFWPSLDMAQGVVLIDELDTHLHPRWKMRILQRLRTAMPKVQFICTTHDPLCLRGLYNGEVQVLQRPEGSPIERVVDLPNVEGLSVEQLLTSDYFGLMSTEDPRLEEEMARYVALATKSDRSAEEEAELQLHRQRASTRIRLGSRPEEQLLLDNATALVVGQHNATSAERAAMRRDAERSMMSIWDRRGEDPVGA
jgi:uncharacterized protein (TIGR02646 family)